MSKEPGGVPKPRRRTPSLQWKSRHAEESVANRLRKQGYQIVARNWRHRLGELDIVARSGNTLAIVEVKARRGAEEGTGLAAVDCRKRTRLIGLARAFLAAQHLEGIQVRFDVAEVELDQAGFPRAVRYVEDAFQ